MDWKAVQMLVGGAFLSLVIWGAVLVAHEIQLSYYSSHGYDVEKYAGK